MSSLVDVGPPPRLHPPLARRARTTRFVDPVTPRSGQQAALGADVIDLLIAPPRPSPIPTSSMCHLLSSSPIGSRPRPAHAEIDLGLAGQPVITVPTVTLDGLADGNFPATDGNGYAASFTGPRVRLQVPQAGHNLPQEAPHAFATQSVR